MDWVGRRNTLDEQIVRKALDIPPVDDMQINQQTTTGMRWKELAVVAAMMGGTAGLTAYLSTLGDTPPPAVTAPATDTDTDSGLVGIGREPREEPATAAP